MSDAGLPGLGIRLGAEILRGPNGIWYSAAGADGKTVGVLRFDQQRVTGPGVLDRLVDRVVAARGGLLDVPMPIVDLIEDSGRIWLITAQLPVAASADLLERVLLGAPQAQNPAIPNPARPYGAGPVAAEALGEWRPEVDLGESSQRSPQTAWDDSEAPRSRRRVPLPVMTLVVAVLAGAGVAAALLITKDKGTPAPPLQVSALAVSTPGLASPAGTAVTKTNVCKAVVRVIALLQTNKGQGTIQYRWDIPNAGPIVKSINVRGHDPAAYPLELDWTLDLHGSGTVVAKFTLVAPASQAAAPASLSLPYTCP